MKKEKIKVKVVYIPKYMEDYYNIKVNTIYDVVGEIGRKWQIKVSGSPLSYISIYKRYCEIV